MLSCAVCWGAEARLRVSLPFHLQPQDEPKPQPGAQLLSEVSDFKTNPTQRNHSGERHQGASEYVIWPCVAAFKIQWSILHFSQELLNVIKCRSVLFNDVYLCVPQSEHVATEEATILRRVSDGSADQEEVHDAADGSGEFLFPAFV